jgi:hypothetical protein
MRVHLALLPIVVMLAAPAPGKAADDVYLCGSVYTNAPCKHEKMIEQLNTNQTIRYKRIPAAKSAATQQDYSRASLSPTAALKITEDSAQWRNPAAPTSQQQLKQLIKESYRLRYQTRDIVQQQGIDKTSAELNRLWTRVDAMCRNDASLQDSQSQRDCVAADKLLVEAQRNLREIKQP